MVVFVRMNKGDRNKLLLILGPSLILVLFVVLPSIKIPQIGSANYKSDRIRDTRPFDQAANNRFSDSSDIRVVDGDTIKIADISYRLVGFDTPEIRFADCDEEKKLGERAKTRLSQLINAATNIDIVSGSKDKYGRTLGRLMLDQQNVGEILIREGLARQYDGGRRASWC